MITLHLRDGIAGFRNEVVAKCHVHGVTSGGVDIDSMVEAMRLALEELSCECPKNMGVRGFYVPRNARLYKR